MTEAAPRTPERESDEEFEAALDKALKDGNPEAAARIVAKQKDLLPLASVEGVSVHPALAEEGLEMFDIRNMALDLPGAESAACQAMGIPYVTRSELEENRDGLPYGSPEYIQADRGLQDLILATKQANAQLTAEMTGHFDVALHSDPHGSVPPYADYVVMTGGGLVYGSGSPEAVKAWLTEAGYTKSATGDQLPKIQAHLHNTQYMSHQTAA